jgi:hypothetical protein
VCKAIHSAYFLLKYPVFQWHATVSGSFAAAAPIQPLLAKLLSPPMPPLLPPPSPLLR